MKKIKSFMLYQKLFFLFIKYALLTEMEYKINFISGILVECGYFLVIYSLFLIPKAFLSFWFISSSSADMLISSVWEANNMPMFIYGKAIRFIGMYIIPVFLIANFSPMWIMETLSIQNIIWELAVVCVTFGMARVIFRQGVKRYNSASS